MRKFISFILIALTILAIVFTGAVIASLLSTVKNEAYVYREKPELNFWSIRSIDTMKYSRDMSREKLNDPKFDAVIDMQIKNIAETGATHVAIATPYDKEFLPMLKRWVEVARKYNLKVWFRGNWSGWEEWFGYPKITKESHIQKTRSFILTNKDLFEEGDIFSSCPECENGGLGDPRSTGDIEEYRKFLINEYGVVKGSFNEINKNVQSNLFPMNGDVARLIMDEKTTASLDGAVTVDHYVQTPDELAGDLKDMASDSGGKIVLGEFGAPIPDIHGRMSESDQAKWLKQSLSALTGVQALYGVNYWVNAGGSAAIWGSDGKAKPAVSVITEFYKPRVVYGVVQDELNNPIASAKIVHPNSTVFSVRDGYFALPYAPSSGIKLQISAPGFLSQIAEIKTKDGQIKIVMAKEKKDLKFRLVEFLKKMVED